jgi:hypothetical protein
MSWLLDNLTNLLLLLSLVIVIMALIAPFEALSWRAGWLSRDGRTEPAGHRTPRRPIAPPTAETYVVYLTGVGGFSGDFLRPPEAAFIEQVQRRLPRAVVIRNVFPYSVNNNPLDGQRILAPLWQWLQTMRGRVPNSVFDILIVVRNTLQVAVSADRRYGPIYNLGVADEILSSLRQSGYPADGGPLVFLIGYSGGAQVAIGAAPYLRESLQHTPAVISIGGFMADGPGILSVRRLCHVQGMHDPLPALGVILYPGRWPLARRSYWNKQKRLGVITEATIGPIKHFGGEDYFSEEATLPDGRTHLDMTVELVTRIVTGRGCGEMPASS